MSEKNVPTQDITDAVETAHEVVSKATESTIAAATSATKSTAKKSTAKKSTAKKSTAKKSTAKKSTATTNPMPAVSAAADEVENTVTTLTSGVSAAFESTVSEAGRLLEAPVAKVRGLLSDLPDAGEVKSRVEGGFVLAGKTVEDAVTPAIATLSQRTEAGRKAAQESIAPVIESVKPYLTTLSAQATEALKAGEKAWDDLRQRADARAAFGKTEDIVTEVRTRAEQTVADLRKSVGI